MTNEYSDYRFQFYLGSLPDQAFGYHRLVIRRIHTRQIHVSKPTFKTNENLKLLIFNLLFVVDGVKK